MVAIWDVELQSGRSVNDELMSTWLETVFRLSERGMIVVSEDSLVSFILLDLNCLDRSGFRHDTLYANTVNHCPCRSYFHGHRVSICKRHSHLSAEVVLSSFRTIWRCFPASAGVILYAGRSACGLGRSSIATLHPMKISR